MMEGRRPGEVVTYGTRAEAETKVDKRKRYAQIMGILSGRELTAKEIAEEMFQRGFTPTGERNFAAPRLTEMSRLGMVEPIGKKKCAWTGKTVAVYAERG